MAMAQRNQRGRAPIAARSERFTASALWPTSSRVNGGVRKWTPCTTASVVTQRGWPRPGASTAQSSPGPRGGGGGRKARGKWVVSSDSDGRGATGAEGQRRRGGRDRPEGGAGGR